MLRRLFNGGFATAEREIAEAALRTYAETRVAAARREERERALEALDAQEYRLAVKAKENDWPPAIQWALSDARSAIRALGDSGEPPTHFPVEENTSGDAQTIRYERDDETAEILADPETMRQLREAGGLRASSPVVPEHRGGVESGETLRATAAPSAHHLRLPAKYPGCSYEARGPNVFYHCEGHAETHIATAHTGAGSAAWWRAQQLVRLLSKDATDGKWIEENIWPHNAAVQRRR